MCCVHAFVCLCVSMCYTWRPDGVTLHHHPLYSFETGSLPAMELFDWPRLGAIDLQKICLSLPSQGRGQRCMPLLAYSASTLWTEQPWRALPGKKDAPTAGEFVLLTNVEKEAMNFPFVRLPSAFPFKLSVHTTFYSARWGLPCLPCPLPTCCH